jgi:hypothetical protein
MHAVNRGAAKTHWSSGQVVVSRIRGREERKGVSLKGFPRNSSNNKQEQE